MSFMEKLQRIATFWSKKINEEELEFIRQDLENEIKRLTKLVMNRVN